uniref:Alpha-macroglobulin receptor-binding domain-containing protein n=1 Tax=Serinus canaria TaxID=9135 RepID=A0A8C9KPA1_SERCA
PSGHPFFTIFTVNIIHTACPSPLQSSVVRRALGCLAPALPKAASLYTQALLAYTFALAKDSQRTQELLHVLDQKAIRADGQIHWSQTSSKLRTSTSPWSQPVPVDVELTAYVLLALLSKPNVTESDLTTASGIVAWLTRQQNAYGGFASTQDTVVALQALAKYAALTHSTQGDAEVRVRSHGGFGKKFQVSYQNRLLVQEAALTEVPGKFLVQAHGSCCVFTRVGSHRPCCDHPHLLILSKPKLCCTSVEGNVHISDTYVLHLEQEIEVTNLKPGHVRVYDYYSPGQCGTMGCLGVCTWLCARITQISPVLLQRSRPWLTIMSSASEVGANPLLSPLYRPSSAPIHFSVSCWSPVYL